MRSCSSVVDWQWSSAKKFLPFDLDAFAVDSGALQRRRGVKNGEALLRTLLLLALPKASIERASVMSRQAGLAKVNSTALFKRLVNSEQMLRKLFFHSLKHAADTHGSWNGLRILIVDATVLCGPAAKGTDQRLHTVYDLGKGLPVSVDLTGPEGGEALWRHACFGSGDLVIADRGYGYNRSIQAALQTGARVLIRFNFQSIVLHDEHRQKIREEYANALVPESGTIELEAKLPDCSTPLRAIGCRNPEGVPVWLLTDLSSDELPTCQVRELYRKRWQVELYFKRLKSLLDLDELPTRDGPTAKAWIWAKLLLSSLAVLLAHERFSPWGEPS